jgi:ribonuclease P protein component
MIEGRFRFHGYGSLKFLYHKGVAYRSRSISLRIAANPRREDGRCAVIVTKKVQKAAPRRNRIRRRVYEIMRTNWDHIVPGHDMLISVYDPQAGEMPYAELEKTIINVLQQANVWQDGREGEQSKLTQ